MTTKRALTGTDAHTAWSTTNSAKGYPSEGRHCVTGLVVPGAWTLEHDSIRNDGVTDAFFLDAVSDPIVSAVPALAVKVIQLDPITFTGVAVPIGPGQEDG